MLPVCCTEHPPLCTTLVVLCRGFVLNSCNLWLLFLGQLQHCACWHFVYGMSTLRRWIRCWRRSATRGLWWTTTAVDSASLLSCISTMAGTCREVTMRLHTYAQKYAGLMDNLDILALTWWLSTVLLSNVVFVFLIIFFCFWLNAVGQAEYFFSF